MGNEQNRDQGSNYVLNQMKQYPQDLQIQIDSCLYIFNLSSNEDNKSEMLKKDVFGLIKSAMLNHYKNSQVQEYSCGALGNLSWGRNDNKTIMMKEEVLPLIKLAMENHPHNPNVQKRALVVLGILSSNDDNKVSMMKEGVLQLIKSAMRNHQKNPKIQEYALGSLWNLSLNNSDNKIAMMKEGIFPHILSAMKYHLKNPNIQERALVVLGNLSLNNDNKILMTKEGVLPLIKLAMENDPNNLKVQEMALGVLANLSLNNDNKILMTKEGVLPLIQSTMKNHPISSKVQENSCSTLFNLSSNSDNCIRMVKEGVYFLVELSLSNHPQSEKIQEYSRKTLFALNNVLKNEKKVGKNQVEVATRSRKNGCSSHTMGMRADSKNTLEKINENEKNEIEKSDQFDRFYHKQAENINDSLGYLPVLEIVSKIIPKVSCKEAVLELQNQTSAFQNLDKIIDGCERWIESFLSYEKNNYLNLSRDEIFAIALYTYELGFGFPSTDNFYSKLNSMLQKRQQDEMKKWAPYLYYLQSALSKFSDEKEVVYRGIHGKENVELIEKEYTSGRRIHWSGYSSTTKKLSVAESFARNGGIIMSITILNGKNISKYAIIRNEEEVLLSPNMSFIVIGECKQKGDQKQLVLHQLDEKTKGTFVF